MTWENSKLTERNSNLLKYNYKKKSFEFSGARFFIFCNLIFNYQCNLMLYKIIFSSYICIDAILLQIPVTWKS